MSTHEKKGKSEDCRTMYIKKYSKKKNISQKKLQVKFVSKKKL